MNELDKYIPLNLQDIVGSYIGFNYFYNQMKTTTDIYKNTIKKMLNLPLLKKINNIHYFNNIYYIYLSSDNFNEINIIIEKEKYKNVFFYGPIETIGDTWLIHNNELKSISLDGLNNLKSIGGCCILGCNNLISISFDCLNKLKTIGNCFMTGCSNLTEISINNLNNLKSIGSYFLSDCNELLKVSFNNLYKLKSIDNNLLRDCRNLTHLTFNDLNNLKSIDINWIYGCWKLTEISFYNLKNLKNINIDFLLKCTDCLNKININKIIFIKDTHKWVLVSDKKINKSNFMLKLLINTDKKLFGKILSDFENTKPLSK